VRFEIAATVNEPPFSALVPAFMPHFHHFPHGTSALLPVSSLTAFPLVVKVVNFSLLDIQYHLTLQYVSGMAAHLRQLPRSQERIRIIATLRSMSDI